MKIKGTLLDLVLIPLFAYWGATGDDWWYLASLCTLLSLFCEFGWNSDDGFYARWHK